MSAIIDLTGWQVGGLTVLRRGPDMPSRGRRWVCRCVCGNECLSCGQRLRQGKIKSCGCARGSPPVHGGCGSPEYAAWRGIVDRCERSKNGSFAHYGDNGITICPEWRSSFESFIAHLGPRPSPAHSVDRINVLGNYEPGNVRWATRRQQANNKRNTAFVTYRGERIPLAEAVRAAGSVIHIEAARIRLRTGWSVERALETPRLHESRAAKANPRPDRRRDEVVQPTPKT